MKRRITRKQITEEIEWTGNHKLETAWNNLVESSEDDMDVINRHWQESEETDWKDFLVDYWDKTWVLLNTPWR